MSERSQQETQNQLTLFAEASPVRTCRLRESAKAWLENGQDSGLNFHRILEELRPEWCIIENVPGLLSSNKGRDFAIVLQGLADIGYRVAYRVLDSQFFGVPQRRRRVFIVGHLGDGRAAEVLFEREGMFGDTAKGEQAGQEVAATLAGCSSKCHSDITIGQQDGNLVVAFDGRNMDAHNVSPTIQAKNNGGQSLNYTPMVLAHGQANAEIDSDGEPSLTANHEAPILTHFRKSKRAQTTDDDESWVEDDKSNTVNGFDVGDTRTTEIVAATSWTLRQGCEGGGKGYLELKDKAMTLGGQPQNLSIVMQTANTNANGIGVQNEKAYTLDGTNSQAVAVGHSGGQTLKINDKVNTLNAQTGSETTAMFNGVMVNFADREHSIDVKISDKAHTLQSHPQSETSNVQNFAMVQGTPWDSQRARIHDPNSTAPSLQHGAKTSGNITPAVWQMNHASEAYRDCGEISPMLQQRMGTGGNNVPLIGVRRLTPTECARLQGFPDDWNSWLSDSARYRQYGNAVMVNVVEWIGKRVMKAVNETS